MQQWLADKICNLETANKLVCDDLISILTGPSNYINTTRLAVYQTHMTGTSVKNMVHFAQMVISGNFQMYDYGSNRQNLIYHNQTTPPLYDLKNINVPVAIYWGKILLKDYLNIFIY